MIILLEEEKKYALRLPPAHMYKFVEQDSEGNIILETRENDVPLIKGATLIKLVERLTYHVYSDPTFIKAFLTTYRSFCSPQALLTLLIERFNIPDPSLFYGKKETSVCKTTKREDWKGYKIEFCHPVQFRVLNVLRHWIDYHFHDFERDGKLLETLQSFLKTINDTSVTQKLVNLLLEIVERKRESSKPISLHFKNHPPAIKSHLKIPENNEHYGILTIHPVEFARQLTLLEFQLYNAVKSVELVGCVWTKEDKNKSSPNLMKMIRHTTNFTRWLEKIIVEAQNFKERVAIVSRAIEIMLVLQDLKNFNGVLAIVGALDSVSIFRLKFTFQQLSEELRETLAEVRQINNNYVQKYKEMLQYVNPPCIPFLSVYLTNILHIEERDPAYLPENLLHIEERDPAYLPEPYQF
ncbi:Protein son of sevenless [Camponotus floridanus]|uniref:Protein son of sevenless n=1 Tax=Camponotus floridanus TaxID=104421 RepID=E2AR67_CAMFO|nr:Protein son of sevenless [Camponotus floridanus]